MSEIVIENFAYPADPPSDAPDPQDRREENLLFAREALDGIVPRPPVFNHGGYVSQPTWQEWLMRVHKPVAAFYGVDSDDLLGAYVEHHAPTWLAGLQAVSGEGAGHERDV